MSRLPRVLRQGVKVGPYHIPILADIEQVRTRHDDPDIMGTFNPIAITITVDPELRGDVLRAIVWHEIKHVIDWMCGVEDGITEEQYVSITASQELKFFQENKKFMAWLEKIIK